MPRRSDPAPSWPPREPGGYAARGLHGQVVEELGHRIVSGAIPTGEPIDLVAFAAELDVSRTVLRESIKVLSVKGLLDARPRRGTYALPRSAWNGLDPDVLRWTLAHGDDETLMEQLEEVRAIVEPAAARLAATRRSPELIDAMRDAIDAMAAAGRRGDAEQVAESDVRFHRVLAAASGNAMLSPIQEVVLLGLRRRDHLVHARERQLSEPTLTLHRDVLDAIERRDADGAERAMRRLLERAAADTRADPDATADPEADVSAGHRPAPPAPDA